MPKERKTFSSKKSSQPKQRKNRRKIHLFTPEFQAKLKRTIDEYLEKITQEEGFVFPTNIPRKDLISLVRGQAEERERSHYQQFPSRFYEDISASSRIIQIQQDNSSEPEYYDSTCSAS
ncbi:19_t:CDS:2 [Funneliformis geosporum]|uniref:17951_t:CDS:1 n=1 Tax=Funneliformis geosporum TaxID=1117311 RepID=A0A9W4ST03_9GLOM|nr:17951_t:CDS:2 [Funneliformis geosporum]CAI2188995.1 19_t:CDS:2 [Funneliformis geosporum]